MISLVENKSLTMKKTVYIETTIPSRNPLPENSGLALFGNLKNLIMK